MLPCGAVSLPGLSLSKHSSLVPLPFYRRFGSAMTSDNAWYPQSRERANTYFTATLMGASTADLSSYQRTLDFLQIKQEEVQGFGIRVLPTATKLDMHQLLSKGGVHRPDKGVMNNMLRRFANRVSLQIDLQDSEAMAVTYFDAAALPSTTTRRNLKQLGYAVGRPIEEGSVISYCFRTSEAISEVLTLKPLNAEETSRIIAFQAAVASGNNEQHHHVLQFSILEALVPNKPAYFIAPCMPATIAMIPGASLNSAVELWNQISSALTYIHSINFAHMDVKPSNIFVTAAPARFVLGDLGSIARVRFPTCSTRSFVPTDFEPICGGQFCASFAIDWWMLAITVLDFVGACHGGGGEFGLSCSRIQELLQSPLYEGKFQFIVQLLESSK